MAPPRHLRQHIGTVTYRPAGSGTGIAYLGQTPRIYFEDDTASEPTDTDREAAGLVEWWEHIHAGLTDPAERADKVSELKAYLADDTELDDDDQGDEVDDEPDELDDADVFVEVKASRFLDALGIRWPDDLA
jgi:hypothetical protein